ncbi:lanthionine synthetase C family protein [Streptomyces sp. NPDC050617]|uniref:lanthionine synthetase C family protein n=1 Tax=Streptomyces sp. NPDC050617 TaxID=3154628 RepID=UPI0034454CDE
MTGTARTTCTTRTTSDAAVPHADAAREICARVLDRLADPAATAADTRIPAEASWVGEDEPLWSDLSLSSGYPGVSLAFSGSTPREEGHSARAHGYLARAMTALTTERHPTDGIYSGPGAVAFATLVAHRATGGYRTALARLDEFQRRLVRTALPAVTDGPAATNGQYETVRGVSGIGRYLLARGETCHAELELILRYLTAMAEGEVTHRGRKVPRWWTLAAPKAGQEAELPDGHLNLGLSHGVSGPLALLSLAWREGVVVDGQREAIEALIALLTRWARPEGDDGGVSWPGYVTFDQWNVGPESGSGPAPQRPSWCYGAPGVSRAVQLAALALDRPDWHALVDRSVRALIAEPPGAWVTDDPGLCHGWGGLLHLLGLLNEHLGDERVARVRDELAAVTVAQFREEHRFGFRATFTHVPQGADVPAFLEGAAGTALALDAYAEGGAVAGWDMALLVT